MSIFEFSDYKAFVNSWISLQPRNGRGVLQRLASQLRVHPTLVSHIFRGPKDLTLEQAALLLEYLKLGSLEGDYFLLLIQHRRAGNSELRSLIERQLNELIGKGTNLVHRVKHEGKLTEEAKRTFYSNWHYSAIRLASSIKSLGTNDAIAEHLGIPVRVVEEAFRFLLGNDLVQKKGQKYVLGPLVTHLDLKSEMLPVHHFNWRRKAMEHYHFLNTRDLVFSAPLAISKKDADNFREKLITLISDLNSTVRNSPSEELRVFNIDWIELCSKK